MSAEDDFHTGKMLRFEGKNLDVFWLLLSDVPSGTLIGLDANIWKVGPNFRGIRDIPFGVHYFFYNAPSTKTDCHSVSAIRCSQFIYVNESRVIRKRWANDREEFVDQSDGKVEVMLSNKLEVDCYMSAYPQDRFRNWIALASHITPDTIKRLQPSCGWIYSCSLFHSEKSNSQDRANLPIPPHLEQGKTDMSTTSNSFDKGKDLLPLLKKIPETDINWTSLPQHPLFPPGSTPAEISQHNIDQTYTLTCLLTHYGNSTNISVEANSEPDRQAPALSSGESQLLGEFHFAFVVFLLGEVLDGWLHWRKLLGILSNCLNAIKERPALYKALITSLYRLLTYGNEKVKPEKLDTLTEKAVNVTGIFQVGKEDNVGFAYIDEWQECDANEPAFLPHALVHLFENIAEVVETMDEKDPQVDGLLARAEGLRLCLERRFNAKLPIHRPGRIKPDGETSLTDIRWDTDEAPVIVMD